MPLSPAALVESFLKERQVVAVEEQQVKAWLSMEEEFMRVQDAVDTLQELLAEQEGMLMEKEEQLADVQETADRSVHGAEARMGQLKGWLDQAQVQLMSTQAALQQEEEISRQLRAELRVLQQRTAVNMGAGPSQREEQLMQVGMTDYRAMASYPPIHLPCISISFPVSVACRQTLILLSRLKNWQLLLRIFRCSSLRPRRH